MGAVEEVAAHEFLHDGAGRIVEEYDVVAVPADTAAHMEQKAWNELQDGRNFVREVFRRMEMTGVEAIEELIFDSVGEVELVRADDIAFGTNTEELALDRIEIE